MVGIVLTRTESTRNESISGCVITLLKIFYEQHFHEVMGSVGHYFSYRAFRGALKVSLYSYMHEPSFRQPYQLLRVLMDIDELLAKYLCKQ